MPRFFRTFGSKQITVIRNEGTDSEERFELEAHVQPTKAFFAVDAQVYEDDILEIPDPRGDATRRIVQRVDVFDHGPREMQHIEAELRAVGPPRAAPIRRLRLENLHPQVVVAASDLFVDGHYSQAVFEACKALEVRVREQSELDLSGRPLMTQAFSGDPPPISLTQGSDQSARDEQEGLRFIFMGVTQGIRNPKGHGMVEQDDPQRALEYLGVISVLFRRLDDAQEKGD
jgi:uncharacterized protein (TIGR02391 family)